MQRLNSIVVIAFLMATASTVSGQRRRGGGESAVLQRNCWLTDYAKARQLAKRTRAPMMVVFRCVP